jgi:argininosuccinate synthase
MKRVVVGYSGGLETAAAVPWLAETFGAEVIALTLDLGQGVELEGIRDEALAGGAARAHVLDVRDEFAADYVLPALRADALDEGRYPMAAALGRPIVARKLVEIAGMEGAHAIAVGAAAGAIDVSAVARTLDPSLEVITAARAWNMSRHETRDYARAHGVGVRSGDEAYHAETNLWGRSIQLGDSGRWPPPAGLYTRTRAPEACLDEAALVELGFDRGTPVELNGVAMPLVELISSLDAIAGGNGVGRIEPRAREIGEAPAAVVLHAAHDALRARLTSDEVNRQCREMSAAYARLIRDGLWFTEARHDIDAFEALVHDRLSGLVRLRLWRGDCDLVAIE